MTAILRRELPPGTRLLAGGHKPGSNQFCFNEAIAFLAGEQWSDVPDCVCPVIRNFTLRLNDRWSDDERQQLLPFLTKVVGTRTGHADEQVRRYLALDWAYRVAIPMAFRYVKSDALAERLEALAPITDADTARVARSLMSAIYTETAARRDAARAELRKQFREVAAAAVAAAVAAAAVAAAVAAAAVAAAVAEAEAEAAEAAVAAAAVAAAVAAAAEAAAVAEAIAEIIQQIIPTLPKHARWSQVHEAIYWPVRTKIRALIAAGAFGSEYAEYRQRMQRGALELLQRMIDVGREVSV